MLEVSLFRVGGRDGGRLLRLWRGHGCEREGLRETGENAAAFVSYIYGNAYVGSELEGQGLAVSHKPIEFSHPLRVCESDLISDLTGSSKYEFSPHDRCLAAKPAVHWCPQCISA